MRQEQPENWYPSLSRNNQKTGTSNLQEQPENWYPSLSRNNQKTGTPHSPGTTRKLVPLTLQERPENW